MTRREDGLLEFVSEIPAVVRVGFRGYFDLRNEDGNSTKVEPPAAVETGHSRLLGTRTEIINWLIARQGYASYPEIGVGDGAHFRAVECMDKVSVDPAEGDYAGARPTHRMTSDGFFGRSTRRFDLILIDGLHHAGVVHRDLSNSLACLAPGGMIECHDLNPARE